MRLICKLLAGSLKDPCTSLRGSRQWRELKGRFVVELAKSFGNPSNCGVAESLRDFRYGLGRLP